MSSPSPSASPSVCPSPSANPLADCTQYLASGQSQQTITRTYPTPTPPVQVSNDALSETAVVHNGLQFHGVLATDLKTTENDAGTNQTINTVLDDFVVFPAATGNIVNIGFHSTDSNGVILDEQNGSGNGIIGQTPLGVSWMNNAAQIINETDPDGTTTLTNIHSDGHYGVVKNEVAGVTHVLENSDGSANMIVPGGLEISVTTVSGGNITINFCTPSANVNIACTAGNTFKTFLLPAWYPNPLQLASDSTTVVGTTSIPGNCANVSFGPTGTQLHEVRSRLDTIQGFIDNETIDSWLGTGAEPVCQQITDTINLYYDYTGQAGAPVFSNGPIQTTVLTQTLGLQSVTAAQVRRAMSLHRTPLLTTQLAITNARIERFRQALQSRQLQGVREFARRHGQILIVKRGNI